MRRAAIVTGASSGIGAAVAVALGRADYDLVLVGRDARRLDECAADARLTGARTACVPVDLCADGAARSVVERAVAAFGRIDALVHSAGTFLFRRFGECTVDELDVQLATHVRAPFVLSQQALPHLGAGASIVIVGSNLAHHGMTGTVAYSASKGAAEVMARTMAVELAPLGIRVNVVSPGVTRTPMTQAVVDDPELHASVLAATPAGRLGEPEEIAAAVAYLCSPDAGFLVGSTILIDGGQNAR